VAAVRDAGATRIAVVRALTDAPDVADAARSLRAGITATAGRPREARVASAR
jgi:thiamine monophosphate synthase